MWPDGEEIERAALEDLHAAAAPELATALGLSCRLLGSARLSMAPALPASAIVINRVLGLGLDAPVERQTLARITEAYGAAEVRRYFVHLHPEARPPEAAQWLQELGLERTRAWVKFERGREAPPATRTTLEIRAAEADDRAAFGEIVADAFDLGAAAAPLIGGLIGRPGWHVFMSFEGDQAAGAGTLFVRDGVGWLDWGATRPAFRGRGSQSAILARRIEAALDLGCRLLATTTGEEVPGDPQHSYSNIVRMGFRPAYLRQNYAPPKPS
ncbi:MAG: hypothetical protein QF893_13055 [Alphaproteobacteria bacterium]|nr:hypothetical protein [Alphaproteobacteria bacterium]